MTDLSLDEWLAYQQQLHLSEIDLGLERIGKVWRRLHPEALDLHIITVAGTNGKGSSVAYLEAILIASGYHVGAYTSPHLVRYNERMRVDAAEAADSDICAAFERIENARESTPLTYFEFSTLAAMLLFERAGVDVVLLEVGLGGRLDAVNLFDADGVIITSIGLDHTDWLGDNLEAIAAEKAGVMRAGVPAVIATADMPNSLQRVAAEVGADARVRDRDFSIETFNRGWQLKAGERLYADLPLPQLAGKHQLDNAAAVVALLDAMHDKLPVKADAIATGIVSATVAGRFQQIARQPAVYIDVAHNREAAAVLASVLRAHADIREWSAVTSFYADKPIEAIAAELSNIISTWHLYALHGSRAAPVEILQERIRDGGVEGVVAHFADFDRAIEAACSSAGSDTGVIVFGSFEVAGDALHHFATNGVT